MILFHLLSTASLNCRVKSWLQETQSSCQLTIRPFKDKSIGRTDGCRQVLPGAFHPIQLSHSGHNTLDTGHRVTSAQAKPSQVCTTLQSHQIIIATTTGLRITWSCNCSRKFTSWRSSWSQIYRCQAQNLHNITSRRSKRSYLYSRENLFTCGQRPRVGQFPQAPLPKETRMGPPYLSTRTSVGRVSTMVTLLLANGLMFYAVGAQLAESQASNTTKWGNKDILNEEKILLKRTDQTLLQTRTTHLHNKIKRSKRFSTIPLNRWLVRKADPRPLSSWSLAARSR